MLSAVKKSSRPPLCPCPFCAFLCFFAAIHVLLPFVYFARVRGLKSRFFPLFVAFVCFCDSAPRSPLHALPSRSTVCPRLSHSGAFGSLRMPFSSVFWPGILDALAQAVAVINFNRPTLPDARNPSGGEPSTKLGIPRMRLMPPLSRQPLHSLRTFSSSPFTLHLSRFT